MLEAKWNFMATLHSALFTSLGFKRAAAIKRKARRLGTTPDAYFKQLLDADLELDHLVATKLLSELSAPIRKAFEGVSEEEIGMLVDASRKRHRRRPPAISKGDSMVPCVR